MSHESDTSKTHAGGFPPGLDPDPAVELAATSAQRVDRALTEPNNDRNEVRPQHDQSSSGVADCIRCAAASAHAAPGESSHEVVVWNLPAELAENEGLHELECTVCGVIGAIQDRELAAKVAELHRDLFGPLRDSVLTRSSSASPSSAASSDG